jgi:DNA mismatch repair protein MutS
VARLAGLPASVVDRARDILKNLESAEYNEYGLPTLAGPRATAESAHAQMELFSRRARGDEGAVLDQIRRCEPERLSPLDALMRLAEWKGRLGKGAT